MSGTETTTEQHTTAAAEEAPVFNTEPFQSESSPPLSSSPGNRRMSAEWDASKVPPSRFQKRKGSVYAVPASRDGHVDNNYAHKFHEKLAEKGWVKK
ncbi:hypothetical protein NKR19_g7588 [Coniochaeta hoffmannii]|uniref:Uncharacterized protein n=1 Tax=Coniochaeta hoffmannii TaxID=91930 RepID=A0AA38RRN2_9PEZI|nr:hypothetical protein NKR19_g7588 [Coniochaeta hoffmannii]